MSCVTIIWSMIASACLTLGVLHGLVWWWRRETRANGIFAVSAVATAFMAACELWMMRSDTPAEFGGALRWLHVPAWAVIVALVGFIRVHLRAGRAWLAWTVCGVRTLSLILNFVFTPNLNYCQITGLRHIRFLGEFVALAEGVPNPWMLVGQVSLLLLIVFASDAMITLWRRGDRPQMRFLSSAIVFFILLSSGQAVLSLWKIVDTPITASLFYMGIVAAMGLELSIGVLRSRELSGDLRESEERLSLAAAAARLGLWVWDLGKDEICITPEGRALFGFTADERIDRSRFSEAVHPEDRETMQGAVTKSLLEDDEYEREYRVVLPDGRTRWAAVRGRVERDPSGRAVRVRGVAIDISERKLSEEKIRKSEEFNRTVLASLWNQIAILDRAGTIIAVNDAWSHFARTNGGVAPVVGVGANYLDVCQCSASAGDATARRTLEGVRSVLEGASEIFEMEYPCDSPAEPRWFLVRVVPLKTPAVGAVVSHADITRLKRSELDVQSHREELAHVSRVAMLGELSGSLAHELNQPLTAILSNAQAAQRFLAKPGMDRAELDEILADIVAADQHAGEVIRRLRLLFRKGEVLLEPLDVNEVVRDVLKLMRSELVYRGVTVETELAEELPLTRGDRVQLQQVVLNLITNASDAMAEKAESGRRLSVHTARIDGDGVRVTVRDSGGGIPAEALKRIFEPFFTMKPQGLGLGLGVCRTILAAHGSELTAGNNPDGGASFHFTLPVQTPATT